jgi:predicted RNA-binding protein with PIN domain
MTYLIDGYNLIYKFPHLEELMLQDNLMEARRELLDLLKMFAKLTRKTIRIVFDGQKTSDIPISNEKVYTIDVYYSLHYSADFLIKEFIRKDLQPRNTTVVTSDKDIVEYVSRFKTKTMKSEDFALFVNQTIEDFISAQTPEKEENPNLSQKEIEYWERLFTSKKK